MGGEGAKMIYAPRLQKPLSTVLKDAAFLGTQNASKSVAAGALPQTPLGSLQRCPDPLAGFNRAYF